MKNWQIYSSLNSEDGIIAGSTNIDNSQNYSFSLALHTGEDREKITINREKFTSNFASNFKFVSQFQVHSSKIINVDNLELTDKWSEFKLQADGFVTSKPNIVLNILTADCIALLAYDKNAKVIGAAHAGWQGSKENMAKNLVNAMCEIGANIKDIKVAISPSIRGCCYEVGEDVAKNFTNYPDSLVKTAPTKWHLDISVVNKEQLLNLGIKHTNIEIAPICTACHSQNYFSYRKENGCSGRFITFIGMVL